MLFTWQDQSVSGVTPGSVRIVFFDVFMADTHINGLISAFSLYWYTPKIAYQPTPFSLVNADITWCVGGNVSDSGNTGFGVKTPLIIENSDV